MKLIIKIFLKSRWYFILLYTTFNPGPRPSESVLDVYHRPHFASDSFLSLSFETQTFYLAALSSLSEIASDVTHCANR